VKRKMPKALSNELFAKLEAQAKQYQFRGRVWSWRKIQREMKRLRPILRRIYLLESRTSKGKHFKMRRPPPLRVQWLRERAEEKRLAQQRNLKPGTLPTSMFVGKIYT